MDAGLGVRLEVARDLKVPTVQIHAPHQQTRTPAQAEAFLGKLKEAGITLTAVFGGFEGESYADIATTAKTVGLVPKETRAARVAEMTEISDFAKLLGCGCVALHIGFVPEDRGSADYKDLVSATRDLLDHINGNGQNLHLETGQESADHLLEFIHDVEPVVPRVPYDEPVASDDPPTTQPSTICGTLGGAGRRRRGGAGSFMGGGAVRPQGDDRRSAQRRGRCVVAVDASG